MNCNRKLKGKQRERKAGQQFLMDFSTIMETNRE